MRSVCLLSDLQACIIGTLLVVAAAFCLNAGVVEADAGSCGDNNGGFICEQGNCCSKASYCGQGPDFCGDGCQVKFSRKCDSDSSAGPTAPPGPTTPVCGKYAGNKKCDNNFCCSEQGHCGTTASYCYSTNGCQSQCRLTPGQIAGVVFGALGGFFILCAIAFGIFKLYVSHQRKKAINRESIAPVHRLFPADAAEDKDACVDIILCHGFAIGDLEREVWKNTWRTRGSEHEPVICWPEEWLGRDLAGKARVFALEYDANVSSDPRRKGSHTDVSEIAKNLLHSLFVAKHKIGQTNAVVLIGHSFGGLVIKSLVVEAQSLARQKATNAFDRAHATSCQEFVSNIRGFIFYAVPHSGAENLEVYIKGILRWYYKRPGAHVFQFPQGTLFSNIKELSRKMEELSVLFTDLLISGKDGKDDLPVFAFIEGEVMSEAVGKIVEDASAMRLSKHNYLKVETANHFTVCRPSKRDDVSYQKLLDVLNPIVDGSPSFHRTTHVDVEENNGSEHSGAQSLSLLHPGKIPSMPQKLTRLIRSRPHDDHLPL